MNRKIKQIDVTEALERAKKNEAVYVLTFSKNPIVKRFNNLQVGDVFKDSNDYIFFVIEEG